MGPNRAQKTTTIKILTNLLKPTCGHAYICGIDVNKPSPLLAGGPAGKVAGISRRSAGGKV